MKRKLGALFVVLVLGTGCGSSSTNGTSGAGYGGTGARYGGSGASGGSGTGGSAGNSTGGSSAGGSAGAGGTVAGSAGSAATGGSAPMGGSGGQAGSSSGGAPSTSNLDIIVEPSDKGAALTHAIQNAQKSVHMTMYLLTSYDVIDALIAKHKAGHDVRVVLNQNFFSGTGNQSVFNQLKSAGVPVHWAPSGFNYTHEKCVIIDGKAAWIMTMNATYSSPMDNREYLAVDRDPADVSEADGIFLADYAGKTATVNGKLVVSPVNSRGKLKTLIDGAHKTLDMEAEELSDYVLVGALDSAASRGVKVHIVLATGSASNAQTKAVANLKAHGVQLVSLGTPYIHAKSLVADGARGYVGSENFTQNSLDNNRELGLIFSAATQVNKVLTTTQKDFANGTAL
jgi:phosphatidylserine/phosphatidylglycerophosphate/cardiolipin synthase-like enzyme